MPFSFPPIESDIENIKNAVEDFKYSQGFNDELRERIKKKIRRYGVREDNGLESVSANLQVYIENELNPAIQRLILFPNISLTKDSWYEMPSPKRDGWKTNTIPLFNEVGEIESFSEGLVKNIYGVNNAELVRIKSVAIRNLVKWYFWVEHQYFMGAN